MSNSAKGLRIESFGAHDSLSEIERFPQGRYLRKYLTDLGATSVLVEPAYFDRDYLDEFSKFYSISSHGYPNTCTRLHFFEGKSLTRPELTRAVGEDQSALESLQQRYLGFIVKRPIPAAPLGRTVLRWYPDDGTGPPRIVEPAAREYVSHICGVPFAVRGLGWQQQDRGVSACATIALWSMLHSAALDETHAVPTTAEITRRANLTASLGSRAFPSTGLSLWQILEAIKACDLAPISIQGDLEHEGRPAFSRERFCSILALLVRSGFPVLICGKLKDNDYHAVCCVGLREESPRNPPPGEIDIQDGSLRVVYLHDDNIGPNVRFAVRGGLRRPADTSRSSRRQLKRNGLVATPVHLKPKAPPSSGPALRGYPLMIPTEILAAVPDELRIDPRVLHQRAMRDAQVIITGLSRHGIEAGVTFSTRFIRIASYLLDELGSKLKSSRRVLAGVRLSLQETIGPMSLYVGVVRIGWGATPLMDILYDTTDTEINLRPFAHVYFRPPIGQIVKYLSDNKIWDYGHAVNACRD